MRKKERDMAEEWLREHDKEYNKFGKGRKKKEGYVYLTSHQLERRKRREIEYRDDLVNRTA